MSIKHALTFNLLLLRLMEAYSRGTVTVITYEIFILENYQNFNGAADLLKCFTVLFLNYFSHPVRQLMFYFYMIHWYWVTTYKPFFSVLCQGMKIWWERHLLEVSHICLFCQWTAPRNDRCTARRSETGSSPSTSCS